MSADKSGAAVEHLRGCTYRALTVASNDCNAAWLRRLSMGFTPDRPVHKSQWGTGLPMRPISDVTDSAQGTGTSSSGQLVIFLLGGKRRRIKKKEGFTIAAAPNLTLD